MPIQFLIRQVTLKTVGIS